MVVSGRRGTEQGVTCTERVMDLRFLFEIVSLPVCIVVASLVLASAC